MRIAINGCGRVGAELARLLDEDGHEVTVIDRNPEAFRRLAPTFGGRAVVGEGIDVDDQCSAGIDQVDAFVAVTDGDNHNVMASQVARAVLRTPIVISQIKDPLRVETFELLGIEAVCPTLLGAERILQEIMGEPGRA